MKLTPPPGFHELAVDSSDNWNTTPSFPCLGTNLLQSTDEIESPVMVAYGEKPQ